MNEKTLESLSALIDGEVDQAAELLRHVAADAELKSHWAEHHRTRAALHGEYSATLDSSFASRVSAAIADEPAILAPVARTTATEKAGFRWQRPLAGLAVAATVAAVSVLGLQNFLTPGVPADNQLAITTPVDSNPAAAKLPANTPPTGQLASKVQRFSGSQIRRAALATDGTYWQVQQVDQQRDPALEKRLNMYLADHMEHAQAGQVKGMLPYSSLVGYDAGE